VPKAGDEDTLPFIKSNETTKNVTPKTEKKDSVKIPLPKATKNNVTKADKKDTFRVTVAGPANIVVKGDEDANDSSLYELMQVDEDQMDSFNEFLKKTYPKKFEDYIINFDKLDYTDINSLRDAWYKYLFGQVPGDSAQLLANEESGFGADTSSAKGLFSSKQDKSPKGHTETEIAENKALGQNRHKVNKSQKEGLRETSGNSETKETSPISGQGQKIMRYTGEQNPSGGLFVYRVQIAACRVPLDEKTLQDIYNGQETTTELFENKWYKYTLGKFSQFRHARKLRDQLQIPGAFVIAYLHGKRIKATTANKRMSGSQVTSDMDPGLIFFRVQIAASKRPLSPEFLKFMYNSDQPINIVKEEGWYKYSLFVGKNYKEAKYIARHTSVPGAFVVAYYENTKLDLHAAIKFVKNRTTP